MEVFELHSMLGLEPFFSYFKVFMPFIGRHAIDILGTYFKLILRGRDFILIFVSNP